jgi:hypothetical protein
MRMGAIEGKQKKDRFTGREAANKHGPHDSFRRACETRCSDAVIAGGSNK